ncbi:AAA family ATPase [Butyricimonas paravirosa]
MIRNIEIQKFKSIGSEKFEFRPLTILTGLNSTGKSSVLQSILLLQKQNYIAGKVLLRDLNSTFREIRNITLNAKEISISVETDSGMSSMRMTEDEKETGVDSSGLELENNLFYLSANRIGAERQYSSSDDYKIGINGEYILGTFEREKSRPILEELTKIETKSLTLSAQVNYWLTYILDIRLEIETQPIADNTVQVRYKSAGIPDLSPFQLGLGVSYLVKVLIMCLRANKDDVLLIENPEIHLHPRGQARLGEFLAFVAKAGVQVVVETHCEHLINKIQYEIYKKSISNQDVILYYKSQVEEPFTKISFKENGKYLVPIPEGFFDATLDELMKVES